MASNRIDKVLRPVERYLHNESTGGILLLASALIAMVWANSPWSESYLHLWENPVSVTVGEYTIGNTLHHWINDGLMAMFFFVVGLELKREIMAGELSDFKKAMLPMASAIGGMIVPAVIYILFNPSGTENNGWGIPMATDIAFAMGIMSLLGKRVPLTLKVFLTALAIADDLGGRVDLVVSESYGGMIAQYLAARALRAVVRACPCRGASTPWRPTPTGRRTSIIPR